MSRVDAEATMDIDEDEEEVLGQAMVMAEGEDTDMCERLMVRYSKSSAPQHRHLCATAAAMRAILQEESLLLTPPAYFAATITAIHDVETDPTATFDPNATHALCAFLSILLPFVPPQSLPPPKVGYASALLVSLVKRPLSTATVRCVVKSLGLLLPLSDLEDWGAIKLPFETFLRFSIDRRPKVRRCAQVCVETVFKSFQCSYVIKKSSKLVLSLFKNYMPLAIEVSTIRITDGSKSEMLSKLEYLEVLHLLNVMKLIVPYLSEKVVLKVLSGLYKLLDCYFSSLTRHILNILEVFFEFSRAEVLISEAENIIVSLVSYASSGEKNPIDTVMSASTLLKTGLDKLHVSEPSIWIRNFPSVFNLLAGFLNYEANTSEQAAEILEHLISHHIDRSSFLTGANDSCDDKIMKIPVSSAIKSICTVFEKMISASGGVPNEHILAVISKLFIKLGEFSYFFMKGILLILSDQMALVDEDCPDIKHLQECIGSAVIAMGPEKILSLVPISFHSENLTCSNLWLIPILKKYVIGASLEFFLEYVMPLTQSLQRACYKDLQTCVHSFWDLLPAFCRYPTDTSQNIESLAKLLIVSLKEDSFTHEIIAVALRDLVNQNKGILADKQDGNDCLNKSTAFIVKDSPVEPRCVPSHYSKKVASRNIEALASSSIKLLQALTDVFFKSSYEKRSHLKEAIGCLASISKSSEVKDLFFSSLQKIQFIDIPKKLKKCMHSSLTKEPGVKTNKIEQEEAQRCIIMEFASSLVEGADEDFVNIVFDYIKPSLQESDGIGQSEAYYTLSRIFKEHAWFYSARFDELIDLLHGLKPPLDIVSLKRRFTCFHFLLVHLLENDLENTNTKAFLILNEIILTLKDSKIEARSSAYDALFMISYSLKSSSSAKSDAPLQRLFSMIIGYLSGASPHIMSGAVAALSLLVYKDSGFCFSVPDLIPSVLVLLQSKANEVVKAVLGFMKVLVSCLQKKDLQKFLSDIVHGILPWSSVSKHHFRSKVKIILEIMIRKCGSDFDDLDIAEKYRRFIKTIVEQRQSKTSFKGVGTSNMTPKLGDSFLKGEKKRVREESSIPHKNNSRTPSTPQKEKRSKKLKGNMFRTDEPSKTTGNGIGSRWKPIGMKKTNKRGGLNEKFSKGQDMKFRRRSDGKRSTNAAPVSRSSAFSKRQKYSRKEKPQKRD